MKSPTPRLPPQSNSGRGYWFHRVRKENPAEAGQGPILEGNQDEDTATDNSDRDCF